MLPSDAAATQAAQRWVTEQQGCREGPVYGGNLLGQPTLADTLCGTPARSGPERPQGWSGFRDPTLVLERLRCGRSHLRAGRPGRRPAPLQVALAPLGEAWEVIGVIQR